MSIVPTPEIVSYGALIRRLWGLSDEALIVNHGAYGAAPIEVLQEQDRFRQMMEAEPTYFMQRILPAELRRAAEMLADFIFAEPDRLVFVENTTAGINAILRSLSFGRDDELLLLSHSYGAVRKTADYVAGRCGARTVNVEIPFPHPDRGVLLSHLDAAIGPLTRLAILDHITSPSALILPIAEMVRTCHDKGVLVIVDGAHAPGQVPVDIGRIGADWYVGNCHKWLMAPKGAAFICARRGGPEIHPTTISHGFGAGLTAEFDWVGTRDWSACLCIPAAIAFHARLGGETLMARNRELAWCAATHLAERFQTEVAADQEWHGAMSLVRMPMAGDAIPEDALCLRARLLDQRCDASFSWINDAVWLRLSSAPYNDLDDFVRLADELMALFG